MIPLYRRSLLVGGQIQGNGAFHKAAAKGIGVGFLFQSSGIQSFLHVGIDILYGTQRGGLGGLVTQEPAELHRIVQNSPLLGQVRSNHHTAVRDKQQLMIGGHVQNRHMRHDIAVADAGLLVDDGLKQRAGLQHAFDQHLPLTGADQGHRLGCALGFVVCRNHNGVAGEGVPQLLRQVPDLIRAAHQNRANQSVVLGRKNRLEGMLVMGSGYHGGTGLSMLNQLFELSKTFNHEACLLLLSVPFLRGNVHQFFRGCPRRSHRNVLS